MAVTITSTESIPEKGVRGVQVDFTDDDGNPVTPNTGTITWTLTDKPIHDDAVSIINSREQVPIASASTIYITLSGDDLAILPGEVTSAFVQRILTVEYEWDSSLLGNNLPGKAQYIIKIENLYYIT